MSQATNMQQIASNKCFGGWQHQYQHSSEVLGCEMPFSVFVPPQAEHGKVPVLYWLSGLTCTDQNFVTKAGAQRLAAELGLLLVMPDTSPRGEAVADDSAYDLGQGAGFYLNATQAPWAEHFRMYDYVTDELPALLKQHFPVSGKEAISGHSMGGHGALILALKQPGRYASCSAFAPIVNPINCEWGRKAFSAYLGDNEQAWHDYDACCLLEKNAMLPPLLVDQGEADDFLDSQKLTRPLEALCQKKGLASTFRYLPGYDHSYYFIASFIDDHLRFHAKHLGL